VANANLIAEALFASYALAGGGGPPPDAFIDTFVDIDRGYFIRTGLVDRRYNPRLAGRVVRHLYAALAEPTAWSRSSLEETPSARVCVLERPGCLLALVLPDGSARLDGLAAGECLGAADGPGRRIDLATGDIGPAPWQRQGSGLRLPGEIECTTPILLDLGPPARSHG
jgi:hypothetical protein